MNFELKSLELPGAVAEKCDALLVLVAHPFKAGTDALSMLVAQAITAGDFEAKAGKMLQTYKPVGLAASRLVLVSTGDGSAKMVRKGTAMAGS